MYKLFSPRSCSRFVNSRQYARLEMNDRYHIRSLEEVLPAELKTWTIRDRSISNLTAFGENYGSLMLKVDLELVSPRGETQTLHLVAKCVPSNKAMREIFNTKVTFRNEIAWYNQILPIYQSFQRQNRSDATLQCFPKYYGSRLSLKSDSSDADEDAVLLLENLNPQGYFVGNRLEGLDLDTARVVLRHLANFHATGAALKIRQPDTFQTKIVPFLSHKQEKPKNFADGIIGFLDRERPEYRHLKDRVVEALRHEFHGNASGSDKWKTALHFDFWINNILIKQSSDSTRQLDLAIIDFQFTIYDSIALDLVFFLVTSLTDQVTKQHFDELIGCYHEALLDFLASYGVDVRNYDSNEFWKELRLQGKGIFARAMFTLLIVLGETGRTIDPSSDDFDPDGFIEMLSHDLTQKQKNKVCLLLELFAERDWI